MNKMLNVKNKYKNAWFSTANATVPPRR